MAVYKVYVMSQGGASVIDHADTIEMGGGGYADAASRSLAESYARTGLAQALRQGYVEPYAVVIGPYGEVARFGTEGNEDLAAEHREGLHNDTARQDCPLCADFTERI